MNRIVRRAITVMSVGLMSFSALGAAQGEPAVAQVEAALAASSAATPVLDLAFGGTFQDNNQYTAAGGEVMVGSTYRIDGTETNPAGQGLTLAGGKGGVRFTSSSFSTSNNDTDQTGSYIAELKFTSSGSQAAGATLFSGGGNVFVRYESSNLVYGFTDTTGAERTATYPAPAAGSAHAISLAYDGAAHKLRLFLDGAAAPTLTATQAAKTSASDKNVFGIGNQVTSTTSGTGFAGTISQARVASYEGAFDASNFTYQSITDGHEFASVNFDGSITGNTYQAGAGEVNEGALTVRGGENLTSNALNLTGPNQGLQFNATGVTFGNALDTGVVAETSFTAGAQPNMSTLVGIGGNVFARYQDGGIRFGYSSFTDGVWSDHVQSAPLPTADQRHELALVYQNTSAGAKVTLFIDSKYVGSVSGPARAENNPGSPQVVWGNDASTVANNRGITGTLIRVRATYFTGAYSPTLVTYQTAEMPTGSQPGQCPQGPFAPANVLTLTENDCRESILAKASAARPTQDQYNYQKSQKIAFFHFSVNTFNAAANYPEWGHGDEDPTIVNPSAIDTDQWVRSVANAGYTSMIAVVKHHDGFMMDQTRYNDKFSLRASPFDGGYGDVLKRLAASGKKYGVTLGVYMSTADSYQENIGIFGNGSAAKPTTIPTLVPGDDRTGNVGAGKKFPEFTYNLDDYNRYLFNTLYETLTEYGDIAEVWFDGAQGNTTVPQPYDFKDLFAMIKVLQPHAVTAITGKDVRWVGNESGVSRFNEWGPIVTAARPDGANSVVSGESNGNLGSDDQLAATAGTGDAVRWYPAEADSEITSGWFWGPQKATAISGDQIMDRFVRSVGRNSTMLLNFPPDDRGLLNDSITQSLSDFSALQRRNFGTDFALGHEVSVNGATSTKVTDGDITSSADLGAGAATVSLDLPAAVTADKLVVNEDIMAAGQQVTNFTLEANLNGTWTTIAVKVEDGNTTTELGNIGFQKILRFTAPVTASQWRLNFAAGRGPAALAAFSLFGTSASDPGIQKDFYVDCTAPLTGPGTQANPMNTLQQFWNKPVMPGTTIYLKGGTSCPAAHIPGYGTDAAPVTVTSYDNGTANVGGQDLATAFAADAVRGFVTK